MSLLSVKFLNTESHTMIDAGRLPVASIQNVYNTLCTAFCQSISGGRYRIQKNIHQILLGL